MRPGVEYESNKRDCTRAPNIDDKPKDPWATRLGWPAVSGARRFVGGVRRRPDANGAHCRANANDAVHGDTGARSHRRVNANGPAHGDADARAHCRANTNGPAHGDAGTRAHCRANANGPAHGDAGARAHCHSYDHADINADTCSNAIAGTRGGSLGSHRSAALGTRRPHPA